jgi:hypothetical protein
LYLQKIWKIGKTAAASTFYSPILKENSISEGNVVTLNVPGPSPNSPCSCCCTADYFHCGSRVGGGILDSPGQGLPPYL